MNRIVSTKQTASKQIVILNFNEVSENNIYFEALSHR